MATTIDTATEYFKYLQNPLYMIEQNFTTLDLTRGGYVPFELFPRQRQVIENLIKYRHNLVTKPRQAGISTVVAAFFATQLALSDPNKPEKIMIIANKAQLAQEFLAKVKHFLAQVPPWVWGENYNHNKEIDGHIVGKGSVKKVMLVNGAEIVAFATSEDALRGYTPTYLVIDEAAFIDNGVKLYNAAMASTITGGKLIMISTPNGLDELYYKTYSGAISGDNNFHVTEMRWYEDPRYNKDLEWQKIDDSGEVIESIVETLFEFDHYREMVEKGYKATSTWYRDFCAFLQYDKVAIAQELDVKFEGSGGNVVDFDILNWYLQTTVEDPIRKEGDDKKVWIWEDPIAGHEYVMGVDVSTGKSKDASSFKIIDVTTYTEVAEYRGHIKPEKLADLVYYYGLTYNAYTVIDTTGGYADNTILKLEEKKYPLLHYTDSSNNNVLKKNKRVNIYNDDGKTAGIKISTSAIRISIIKKYISYLDTKTLKIRSVRHINELKTYVWIDGRPDHMKGYNDDIIMASAMPIWICENFFKNIKEAVERDEVILKIISQGLESTLPAKPEKPKQPNKRPIYTSRQDPTGQHSWLFWK